MRTRRTTLFLASSALLMFTACKKEIPFSYKASCNRCVVSYYDADQKFIGKETHEGTFEKEISVAEFTPVMIAVQSSVTDPADLVTDRVYVELKRSGKVVCSDSSSNGKKFQAVSCEYVWPK